MPVRRLSLYGILFACSGALLAAGGMAGAAVITLDAATRYQTVTGWEATAWANQDSPAFPNFIDTLADQAANDLGINRVRLELRSGSENSVDYWTQYHTGVIDYPTWRSVRYATVNDNADPNTLNPAGYFFSELDDTVTRVVTPLKQKVEARGEKFYVNLNYVAFTGQIGSGLQYIHDDPQEYAEFVLAAFRHLQSRFGWVPDYYEIILEPDNVSQWSGSLIGQAVMACANRLQAEGFHPRFIVPSTTNMGNAVTYFDQMVQVAGFSSYLPWLAEISYHRYGGVSTANLQAIASRGMQYQLNTAMLEWWNDPNPYLTLRQDLELGRNSAWQEGTLVGLYSVDESNPNSPVVQLSDHAKFTRQYYKFIRSGAVRIAAASTDGNFSPLAFINSNGGYAVVVQAAAAGGFTLADLPPATYGVKYTTASQYDVDLADQALAEGAELAASIPGAGVITVYDKSTPSAPDPGASRPPLVYPNPGRDRISFRFQPAAWAHLQVRIFNFNGELAARISGDVDPVQNTLTWDAGPAAPGVYLYQVDWNGRPATRGKIAVGKH